jgi:hypothetical protein
MLLIGWSLWQECATRREFEVTDSINQLFNAGSLKQCVALVRQAQDEYSDLDVFLDEAAAYLSPRLYERFYDESPPEALFGLCAASLARTLFPPEQAWRPVVQQAWLAAQERKRAVWEEGTHPARSTGDLNERWQRFQAAAGAGDVAEALSWGRGFLEEASDLRFFRRQSLRHALGDTAFGGRKFVFLSLAWRLVQQIGSKQAGKILFSPLHYLIIAPSDRSLCATLFAATSRFDPPLARHTQVGEQDLARWEQQVLFGRSPQDSIGLATDLVASGADPERLFDVLLLAAAQAVVNAQAGAWIHPLRAFHVVYWARELCEELPEEERSQALLISAALLFQASRLSREVESNRELDEVIREVCPTAPFDLLTKVISLSDPYAAATAAYAIVGMGEEKIEELFRLLARQAAKIDPSSGKGNDILFVWEAAECYRRSTLPWKHRLTASVAFLLARILKKYDLAAEYGV